MTTDERANRILEQAKLFATQVSTWADFSNRLFSPGGIVAKEFPDLAERRAFFDSPQHAEISHVLMCLMRGFGVAEGANPKEPIPRTTDPTPPASEPTTEHGDGYCPRCQCDCFTLRGRCTGCDRPAWDKSTFAAQLAAARAERDRLTIENRLLTRERNAAIDDTGCVEHTSHADCVGCGCMSLSLRECVGIVVSERDRLKAACEAAEAVIAAWDKWEGGVIADRKCWGPNGMSPYFTVVEPHFSRLVPTIQQQRNAALAQLRAALAGTDDTTTEGK